jgi:transcriptional regulator with XRE-family HTH domain
MILFFHNKLREIRKKNKMTMKQLCHKLKIGNTTLWEWEKGKKNPKKFQVRMLAEALNTSVDQISNLKPQKTKSAIKYSETFESWLALANLNNQLKSKLEIKQAVDKILNLNQQLLEGAIIVKALLSAMNTIFYIKDSNLKYITANDHF